MALISVTELARRLGRPDLRIVDTRWSLGQPGAGREAYLAGHIPGALHLDLDTDLSAPMGQGVVGGLGRHPLPSPATFAARLAQAGIGDGDVVVAYDAGDGGVAARLWWMLDALGHPAVAVLDGGWQAWQKAGLPATTEASRPTATSWPGARLRLAPAWPRTIERQDLVERLGSVVLLDARAPERYRGEVEPIDPAAGHVPTARSSPLARNLGPDGLFLDPGVLRARFASLGVGPRSASRSESASGSASATTVVSCGSGTNACQLALALRLAGLPDPLLYVGSFSDWSRAGLPIASGDEPGLPPEPG